MIKNSLPDIIASILTDFNEWIDFLSPNFNKFLLGFTVIAFIYFCLENLNSTLVMIHRILHTIFVQPEPRIDLLIASLMSELNSL